MSINVNDKNLGHATAYAYYKAGGGTMTEAEFTEFMADFGTASQTAVEAAQAALASKNAAQTAATTATNKASEATTAATTATNKAAEAQADADAAALDASQALSAASTATTKATEATTAAAAATSAKTDAVAANTAAQSAKTAAQTAQTGAETAAASVQASAAQITQNTSDISELKEDFTQMESDGVVPSAEQILTDKGVTDSVPYHYRKTGGDGADRLYDQIVGGTVNWNQLAKPFTSDYWSAENNVSVAFADSVATFTSQTVNNGIKSNAQKQVAASHVYYMGFSFQSEIASTITCLYGGNGGVRVSFISETSMTGVYKIAKADASASGGIIYLFPSTSGVNVEHKVKNVQVFDLTAMFGSTIADYIYSLEQATAGAGVAFFKSLFPNDYYPYNAGELVSVSGLSAHVMRDADDNIIRSYPLDSDLTLRGIPKLVDGKMCFDGDTYDSDGTVTRRYGVVDLGTLNWSGSTGLWISSDINTTAKRPLSNSDLANIICNSYIVSAAAPIASNDGKIGIDSIGRIQCGSSAPPTGHLLYELATPTTETADPYQHLQQCDPNGTEEYVSTGIVPIGHNSFYPENLRAKIEQLPWNFASLIAPTESAFVATRNYTTGSLFIVNNVLYKATSNIANGGTITPNTNCTATTLAEIISALA